MNLSEVWKPLPNFPGKGDTGRKHEIDPEAGLEMVETLLKRSANPEYSEKRRQANKDLSAARKRYAKLKKDYQAYTDAIQQVGKDAGKVKAKMTANPDEAYSLSKELGEYGVQMHNLQVAQGELKPRLAAAENNVKRLESLIEDSLYLLAKSWLAKMHEVKNYWETAESNLVRVLDWKSQELKEGYLVLPEDEVPQAEVEKEAGVFSKVKKALGGPATVSTPPSQVDDEPMQIIPPLGR